MADRPAYWTLRAYSRTVIGLILVSVALVWSETPVWLTLILLAISIIVLIVMNDGLRQHFQGLERVRGAMVMTDDTGPRKLPDEVSGLELQRLFQTYSASRAALEVQNALPDDRLQAIVASRREALLVITEDAQVSLVNYPALHFLGEENVKVGTSIFAAIDRDSILSAMEEAKKTGSEVTSELLRLDGLRFEATLTPFGGHGGMIVSSVEHDIEHQPMIDHDLSLHDRPPERVLVEDDTPLSELPVLVLDLETTGLDVVNDRVVSIGAVRLHGRKIYRSYNLDRLVNPAMAIPKLSTSVHGITDGMVADAPEFVEAYKLLEEMMAGLVIVGHNVAYDVAMLRNECARHNIPWQEPQTLDTLCIASLIEHRPESLELESLAQHYGIDVHGRHTALGDALVTAEIYSRMVVQMQDQGVTSFSEAQAFTSNAQDILQRQKDAGW